jgi:hypothetical protein
MVENEVKIYDSKINLRPVNAENINPNPSLPLKKKELISCIEKSGGNQVLSSAKRRKIKRTKSSGIF